MQLLEQLNVAWLSRPTVFKQCYTLLNCYTLVKYDDDDDDDDDDEFTYLSSSLFAIIW